jgi:hypothetical protein
LVFDTLCKVMDYLFLLVCFEQCWDGGGGGGGGSVFLLDM